MFIKKVFILLMGLVFSACGGGYNPDLEVQKLIPDSQKLGNQKLEIITGADNLKLINGVLEGSGEVRFAKLLSQTDSANLFVLDFELDVDGSVTLISNSLRDLSKGVEIKFYKTPGSSSLNVEFKVGSGTLDQTDSFSSLNASRSLSIALDIHNNHGANVHLLAWDESNNSLELLDDFVSGKGFGSNWGLRLQNAKVISVVQAAPRHNH